MYPYKGAFVNKDSMTQTYNLCQEVLVDCFQSDFQDKRNLLYRNVIIDSEWLKNLTQILTYMVMCCIYIWSEVAKMEKMFVYFE